MKLDKETVHTLYKKLLTFYPRAFRQRFGEAMEQTFDDLYNERSRPKGQGWLGFVLWMFVETAMGIVSERAVVIKEMTTMKNFFTSLSLSAIISFLIVLPFIILELTTSSNAPRTNLSLFGYVFLWILPMTFILILMPIVRTIRAGNNVMIHPVFLLLRSVFLVVLAWTWGEFIVDQMPCFLGASGC
jgi:hypothetical protein